MGRLIRGEFWAEFIRFDGRLESNMKIHIPVRDGRRICMIQQTPLIPSSLDTSGTAPTFFP
jgi:hypothetical protein